MPSFMSRDRAQSPHSAGQVVGGVSGAHVGSGATDCTALAGAFLAANPSYVMTQNGVRGMSAAGAAEFYRQNPGCTPPGDMVLSPPSSSPSGLAIIGAGVAVVAVIYFLSGR